MYDFTVNFMAWYIFLCIIILPPFLILKLIKKIVKRIKNNKTQEKPWTEYTTEWTWNEERKLWVHPNSEKGNKGNSQYRYKGNELFKGQPTQPTYFNHTDTSFKTKQEPQIKVTVEIPKEIKEKHEKNKQEQTEKQTKKEETKSDYNYKPSSYTTPKYTPEPPKAQPSKYAEYRGAYKAAPLLTENERRNFRALKAAADRKGYSISMKVRLADLVTPKGGTDYMAKFGKIKSKHVDFVIYDQNIMARAIIELDDRTHDRKDRQDRDEFVDTILRDAGYKVIHTRYITPDILDGI